MIICMKPTTHVGTESDSTFESDITVLFYYIRSSIECGRDLFLPFVYTTSFIYLTNRIKVIFVCHFCFVNDSEDELILQTARCLMAVHFRE